MLLLAVLLVVLEFENGSREDHLKDCKKPKDQKKIELARSKFRPRGNRRFQPQGRRDDKSNKPFNQNHRRAHLLEQGKRRVKGAHATPGDRTPPVEVNQVAKIAEQEANVAARAGAVCTALRLLLFLRETQTRILT